MAGSISFHSEKIEFNPPKPRLTKKWIAKVALQEKYQIDAINYIFCTDEFLLKLNKTYLKHKTYTDILTFDYSSGKSLVGDIYISIERVEENARDNGVSFKEELKRVMIHGILHMMGYSDKKPREKAVMRKKEEACLSLFPN